MTGMNWQPSFRGAMHAEDVAATTTANEQSNIDPSPLIGDDNIERTDNNKEAGRDADTTPHAPSPPTWRHPFTSTVAFFTDLSSFFGPKFLSWLAIEQCLISGGAFALVMALGLPLFKELGIGASRQQLYMALILSPWSMKPFIGVASDLFPIGGYNKRYFAVYSILIGLVGCSVLLGVYNSDSAEAAKEQGYTATQNFADIVVLCFTLVSFEASTLDILGEGKYSEIMRVHPESGSSIISFKFGWGLLGSIVISACVGPLSDAGYFHVLFWIALALSLTPLYPTLAGWIPEKKRTAREPGMTKICRGCLLFDKGSFQEKKAPFIIITLCGLCAPLTSAITTYVDLAIGLIFSGVFIILFTVATYYIFPKSFFRVFLAIVFFSLDWISMGSAIGYYYTASEECVPGGPNFDYTYYITITGIVGSVVNFLGVIIYQNTLSKWTFRTVLIFATVFGCLASIIDVIIIMRWNIAIGIPDKVFFLLGNAVVENLLGVMWGVASSAMFAKIAPPGMESAVFAYTVGISNYCNMVSSLLGSGIIQWSGMKTIGDDCNFEALPYLIVICQILVPMLVGIPSCFLIPNVLQTEHLIDWDKEGWYEGIPTEGPEISEHDVHVSNDDKDEEADDPRLESHLI
mmetsp:Transcript_29273/g.62230  ORF Transcript_29273/g.62230 Transcript_29273/m.62230 type:complete len:632 (+) Transcript_29273:152-2047(+)|eukprot:CAMPEP_0172305228 /NCGR_PEP_ID=MMETSP1058-20130122/6558_1 /TAXON_ID=83371 /ORGANISM="Detonula confervacea, Strain CCMP 353" /LENGTH=631 /DNA_ID=CAMNT_0013016759 /DNA_START=106 /DNA_END=2001 /DNA_ORIENTATION=+